MMMFSKVLLEPGLTHEINLLGYRGSYEISSITLLQSNFDKLESLRREKAYKREGSCAF